MKKITLSLLVLGLAGSAFCADKAELDVKIRMLATKLEALQDKPDKAIPPANLNKAVGIILLDRTKAGFFFAYEGGGGVALLKDPKTKRKELRATRPQESPIRLHPPISRY